MKLADIVGMAIHNLIQRRMRTALNLVGIVIGCTTLLMTAAGGQGVGSALHGLLDSSPHAKQMIIRYGYGEEEVPEEFTKVEGDMSEERRARIEAILEEKWRDENIPWTERMITKEQIERIAALPHVTEVITRDWFRSVADGPDGAFLIELQGCSASDREVAERLIAGRMLSGNSTDEILVHEYLAYRLGFRSDASLDALVGTELSLKWGTSRMQLGQMVWALDDQPTGVERFEMQVELAGAIQNCWTVSSQQI